MKNLFILIFFALTLSATAQKRDIKLSDLKRTNPAFAASVLYADGVTAKLKGQKKAAFTSFSEVIKLQPRHAAAYYQISTLASRQDTVYSLGYARKAFELDPTNYDYLSSYCSIMIDMGKYLDAKNLLDKLIKSGYHTQKNYYLAAVLASQLEDFDSVIELSAHYLEEWGFHPLIVDVYAQAMIAQRRYLAADDLLTEYTEKYPTEARLKVSLGRLKAAMFKDEQALKLFENAIETDPTDYRNHLALAEYYREKKEIGKYLVALRPVFDSKQLDSKVKAGYFENTFFDVSLLKSYYLEVQQIALSMYASDPSNQEIEKVYSQFLMYTGDVKSAKYIIAKRIEEGRADEENYRYVIEIENYLKQPDSAMYYASLGEKKYPKSANFPLAKAITYFQEEDNTAALNELKRAFKLAQTDSAKSALLTFEGDIYYKIKNNKKAFAAYDKAIKLDPDNAGLLNNYAYYLSLEGKRLEDALRMSEKSNELDDGNPTYLDTQAWVLYCLGDYEKARLIQRRALALSKNPSEDLLRHYGDILFKLGDNFLAETYWKQALEAGADPEEMKIRFDSIKK